VLQPGQRHARHGVAGGEDPGKQCTPDAAYPVCSNLQSLPRAFSVVLTPPPSLHSAPSLFSCFTLFLLAIVPSPLDLARDRSRLPPSARPSLDAPHLFARALAPIALRGGAPMAGLEDRDGEVCASV